MAKKTCSRCGTTYSSFFSRCPQCSYEEGMPLPEEKEDTKGKDSTQSLAKDSTPQKKKAPMSRWYNFAQVLIIIESIAIVILFVLTVLTEESEWMPFLIMLGVYLSELCFLGIIQLLAGIKQGIDSLQK